MRPGNRMMLLDKMREPNRRSEYGNDPTRRMIGYDRAPAAVPAVEPAYPPMGMAPSERSYPPMGMAPTERNYSPMGMASTDRRYNPRNAAPTEWDYAPMGMYEEDRRSYNGPGPEMRRRRDRRGRYMMAGMEPDDDEEDDKYRLKDGKMITGAVWMDGAKPEKVDESKAMEWTREMRNPDGTLGPHFKPEMAEQLRAAHCPKCDKWEFMVAVNMMYADYADVAKKFAADKPEFYACMAKAFLEDPDAGKGKLAKYMETIPA